jgi:predicted nucleotidyltransferase
MEYAGIEKSIGQELDMLKDIIIQTVPVDQIFLFGSFAYGTPHKDSDLDLMVILKDDAAIRDMDAIIKIRYAIDERKSMPVDIVVSRHSAFGRRKEAPVIERKIAREGLCIYG